MQPQTQQQQFVRAAYRANQEQFAFFVRGVEAILLQWTALLLVNNQRDNIALQTVHDEVLAWYYDDGEVYADQLESYFEDFFGQTHVVLEDGSPKEVADAIYDCYVKCCQNDGSAVERYEKGLEAYRKINPVAHSVYGGEYVGNADGGVSKVGGGGGDEEEGEDDEVTVEEVDPTLNAHQHNIMQHLALQQQQQQALLAQQQAAGLVAPTASPTVAGGGVNLMQYNAAPAPTAQQQQDFANYINATQTANAQFFVRPPTDEELRIQRELENPKPKQKKIVKDKDGWCTMAPKKR